MNRNQLIALAGAGSVGLLGGAFVFQALGYAPCAMCIWQRWPHGIAIAAAALALLLRHKAGQMVFVILGLLSAITTSAVGFFHSGVEQKWWAGPSSCTGTGGLNNLTGADLLSLDAPRLIMCDQISWQFLGLSMPTWNGILSLILAVVWFAAARRK